MPKELFHATLILCKSVSVSDQTLQPCQCRHTVPFSGAGTNLTWGGGQPSGTKDIFWVVSLHFLALHIQGVVFVSIFVMGRYSLVSFSVCCSAHGAPTFVKVGGTYRPPPVPCGVGVSDTISTGAPQATHWSIFLEHT